MISSTKYNMSMTHCEYTGNLSDEISGNVSHVNHKWLHCLTDSIMLLIKCTWCNLTEIAHPLEALVIQFISCHAKTLVKSKRYNAR